MYIAVQAPIYLYRLMSLPYTVIDSNGKQLTKERTRIMKATTEKKVNRLMEKPTRTPPAKVPKEKPAQAPKAKTPKAKKERHSMKGLNAFIHIQAALGKSAKEIRNSRAMRSGPRSSCYPAGLTES